MTSFRRIQPIAPFVCQSCRAQLASQSRRPFASTARRAADNAFKEDPAFAGLSRLSQNLKQSQQNASRRTTPGGQSLTPIMDALDGDPIASLIDEHAGGNLNLNTRSEQTHRLHVYAHKHNTHITLVQPPRSAVDTASSRVTGAKTSTTEQKKVVDVLISLSTGNIGMSINFSWKGRRWSLMQTQASAKLHALPTTPLSNWPHSH